MKRVIVAVIVGLCLSHTGYAQNEALAGVFDVYANYEKGFSYVYMGKGYRDLSVSAETTKEFSSVKFVKILTAPSNAKATIMDFVEVTRATVVGEEFELILKLVSKGKTTEIYLKRTGKKFLEKVIIIDNGKDASITWIYGEEKDK